MFNWLKGIFNKGVLLFKELLALALPLAKQAAIGYLKDVAIQVVAELAVTDLTNEEKRKRAFDNIKQYAINNGIEAKDHLISLIVEMAVSAYKEKYGAR